VEEGATTTCTFHFSVCVLIRADQRICCLELWEKHKRSFSTLKCFSKSIATFFAALLTDCLVLPKYHLISVVLGKFLAVTCCSLVRIRSNIFIAWSDRQANSLLFAKHVVGPIKNVIYQTTRRRKNTETMCSTKRSLCRSLLSNELAQNLVLIEPFDVLSYWHFQKPRQVQARARRMFQTEASAWRPWTAAKLMVAQSRVLVVRTYHVSHSLSLVKKKE